MTQEKTRIEAKNNVGHPKVEDGRGKFAYIFSHCYVAFPFLVLLVIEPYEICHRFSWHLFLLTVNLVSNNTPGFPQTISVFQISCME